MSLPPGPPDWPTAPPLAGPPVTDADDAPPPAALSTPRPTAAAPPAPSGGASPRDIGATALVVLGAVLLALGNVVAWADSVARDEESYVDAEVLDLEDGGLERMISDRLTTALLDWADLERRIDELLPGPLGVLGGPTEDLARTAVDETVASVLGQEPLAGQIARLEEAANPELVQVLLSESDWFRLDGTTLILDLDPLVQAAAQRFDELIPDALSDALPAISSTSLIPDDIEDGGVEITVGEVPVLHEATTELADLGRSAVPIALAGAGLVLLGVVVGERRRRTLVIAGVAVAGAAMVLGVATWTAGAPPVPSTDALRAIAGHSFTDLDAGGLVARSTALFAAGLAAAGVAALVRPRPLDPAPAQASAQASA